MSPTEPGGEPGSPLAGEAYATAPLPALPQSLVARYDAGYTNIYGTMGVVVTVALVRGDGAVGLVPDRTVLVAWNHAWLQLAVTASRGGRWQAYFPDDHSVTNLSHGDTAYIDLGKAGTAATWWLFPDQAGPLVLWLFAYLDGRSVFFDPQSTYPHRVDTNGGLRCFVSGVSD